jgi:hypothetical protein
MRNNMDYTIGWVDSSIHEFLLGLESPPPAAMGCALITCLDSCFDMPMVVERSREIRLAELTGKFVGKGFLVKTHELLSRERKHPIFFGFEEVFFFASSPRKSKPEAVTLVGPEKLSEPLPGKWVGWLRQTRCSLALGDGTGLNFIAKLEGIAKYLVPHLVEHAPERAS